MAKSLILIIPIFYIVSLAQTSFLVHFDISGFIPNFILISVILINLFQRPENPSGLWAAVFGGFFFDIFSSNFIGFYILICLTTSIFIKVILKDYVRIPFVTRT
jgi:rod shape-determining protein MreD